MIKPHDLGSVHGRAARGGGAVGGGRRRRVYWAAACCRMGGCSLCRIRGRHDGAGVHLRSGAGPAGAGRASRWRPGACGCVLLADGRVLLVPPCATSPLIYDPKADTITTSAAVTPAELQTGIGLLGRRSCCRTGGCCWCRCWRRAADLQPSRRQPGGRRSMDLQGSSCAAGCCCRTAGCCWCSPMARRRP